MASTRVRKFGKFMGGVAMAAVLCGTGYAQAPQQNPPASSLPSAPVPANAGNLDKKVVMKVGDEQVTQADIDFILTTLPPQAKRQLATQGKKALGDQYATLLVLEQRALAEHLDAAPTFTRQLAMQRRQLLAEAAYNQLAGKATVTPEEASQYYSSHPDDFTKLKIRQVIVRKHAEAAPEGTKGLTAAEAKTRAEEIRKVMAAGTDPKKVIEQFQVPDVVIIDPEPREVARDNMRPDMQQAAAQLKDGGVSEVFDLPQALVFFQLVGHHQQELKDVSTQIESTLKQKKIEAALADLKKDAHIWTDDAYFAAPVAAPIEGPGNTPAAPSATPPAATPANPPAKP